MRPHSICGFLNIDKPTQWTSRDVVNKIQRLSRGTKIGHAGTLDPMASGVLVMALGRATKLIQFVQRMPKTYVSQFRLGLTSDTDDIWGKLQEHPDCPSPSEREVRAALQPQMGAIMQLPPRFSALKISGQRAYQLARRGKPVELQPRPVEIFDIQLVNYEFPYVDLQIQCGSGTYIRSIARDLGSSLGCGAVMSRLRRTAIGSFGIEQAATLEALGDNLQSSLASPLKAFAELPCVPLSAEAIENLRHGRRIELGSSMDSDQVVATLPDGQFAALLCRQPDNWFRPQVNWVP